MTEALLPVSHRGFLQTALFVDDQAFRRPPEGAEVEEVKEPDSLFEQEPAAPDLQPSTIPNDSTDPTTIDQTESLVESLADHGISCSVLAPPQLAEADYQRILALAQRTDMVILDWNLGPASTSANLILQILAADSSRGGRLRLIVVYTSEPAIIDLAEDLLSLIQAGSDFTDVARQEAVLVSKNFRISFVQKDNGGGSHAVGLPASLNPERLVDHLLAEFDSLTGPGLLQRLALRALSEVRDRAHHVLSRFEPGLDAAFIGHRAQTSHRDAVLMSLELLGTELSALVRTSDISRMLSEEMVAARVDELIGRATKVKLLKPDGSVKTEVETEVARRCLIWPTTDNLSAAMVGKNDTTLSSFLLDDGIDAAELRKRVVAVEQSFGLLSSTSRSRQNNPHHAPPTLEFGNVVRDRYSKYLLCIQPLCDSVRVKADEAKIFHFLELDPAPDLDFDVLVWDEGLRPLAVRGLGSAREIGFLGDPESLVVKSTEAAGSDVFTSEDDEQYVWIGTVREAQVRRTVHQLVTNLTRVGLDEPYFLTRRK